MSGDALNDLALLIKSVVRQYSGRAGGRKGVEGPAGDVQTNGRWGRFILKGEIWLSPINRPAALTLCFILALFPLFFPDRFVLIELWAFFLPFAHPRDPGLDIRIEILPHLSKNRKEPCRGRTINHHNILT